MWVYKAKRLNEKRKQAIEQTTGKIKTNKLINKIIEKHIKECKRK